MEKVVSWTCLQPTANKTLSSAPQTNPCRLCMKKQRLPQRLGHGSIITSVNKKCKKKQLTILGWWKLFISLKKLKCREHLIQLGCLVERRRMNDVTYVTVDTRRKWRLRDYVSSQLCTLWWLGSPQQLPGCSFYINLTSSSDTKCQGRSDWHYIPVEVLYDTVRPAIYNLPVYDIHYVHWPLDSLVWQ